MSVTLQPLKQWCEAVKQLPGPPPGEFMQFRDSLKLVPSTPQPDEHHITPTVRAELMAAPSTESLLSMLLSVMIIGLHDGQDAWDVLLYASRAGDRIDLSLRPDGSNDNNYPTAPFPLKALKSMVNMAKSLTTTNRSAKTRALLRCALQQRLLTALFELIFCQLEGCASSYYTDSDTHWTLGSAANFNEFLNYVSYFGGPSLRVLCAMRLMRVSSCDDRELSVDLVASSLAGLVGERRAEGDSVESDLAVLSAAKDILVGFVTQRLPLTLPIKFDTPPQGPSDEDNTWPDPQVWLNSTVKESVSLNTTKKTTRRATVVKKSSAAASRRVESPRSRNVSGGDMTSPGGTEEYSAAAGAPPSPAAPLSPPLQATTVTPRGAVPALGSSDVAAEQSTSSSSNNILLSTSTAGTNNMTTANDVSPLRMPTPSVPAALPQRSFESDAHWVQLKQSNAALLRSTQLIGSVPRCASVPPSLTVLESILKLLEQDVFCRGTSTFQALQEREERTMEALDRDAN